MARLIDIDAFRREFGFAEECKDCKRDAKWKCDSQMYSARDICGWLDDTPTAGGWISVKDTLPMQREYIVESNVLRDTSKYVLIYITATFPFERKFVTIGRYDFQHERWVVRSSHNGSVTHWMPLPEPPEEETDEQE